MFTDIMPTLPLGCVNEEERGLGARLLSCFVFFFTFKEQKSKPSASAYPSPGLEKGQKPSASENQALTVLNKHLKCH